MATNDPNGIRILEIRTAYETFSFRAPYKSGGAVIDTLTVLQVECDGTTAAGRRARGFGSMPLGNAWAFPSASVVPDLTLVAMKMLAERCARLCENDSVFGHPIDLGLAWENQFMATAAEVGRDLALAEPIPKLAVLVTGSAFDAALHDAFGRAHGLNCYRTYGPEFMSRDLGAYLGADHAGEWLNAYLETESRPFLALYHSVGALDPLAPEEVARPVGDGLPESLTEWIRRDGLTHLKIKLKGGSIGWDLARLAAVDRVAYEARPNRGCRYSLDLNEGCADQEYLVELLRKFREMSPEGFDRINFVEQPTGRDLRANPRNRMDAAARLKPVVIDESLTDVESLLLAREMGYSGAALKACKGQTQSLLIAAAAQKLGMFLCVQDLTCPGAALIHSAGLAAHIPGVTSLEANARQFCPAANAGWEDRFPGVFRIRNGIINTGILRGPGLGAG